MLSVTQFEVLVCLRQSCRRRLRGSKLLPYRATVDQLRRDHGIPCDTGTIRSLVELGLVRENRPGIYFRIPTEYRPTEKGWDWKP